MRTETYDLALNAGAAGDAFGIRDFTDCTVEIAGTLSAGTVTVKGRIGSGAWNSLGTTTTSPALITWTGKTVNQIQVDLTGVTQTGLTAKFAGKNMRADD